MERTWPRAPAGVSSWSDSCLARARQWNSWNLMTSSGELRQRPSLSRSCSTTHSTTAVMGKDPCRSSCRNTFHRLARAVDHLHALGHRFVEIVTDHGFIHLPPGLIDDLGHPELSAKQAFERKPRHAILKPDAPVEGVLRLASPLTPDLMLGFPEASGPSPKPRPISTAASRSRSASSPGSSRNLPPRDPA